jgi:hypothetical protein
MVACSVARYALVARTRLVAQAAYRVARTRSKPGSSRERSGIVCRSSNSLPVALCPASARVSVCRQSESPRRADHLCRHPAQGRPLDQGGHRSQCRQDTLSVAAFSPLKPRHRLYVASPVPRGRRAISVVAKPALVVATSLLMSPFIGRRGSLIVVAAHHHLSPETIGLVALLDYLVARIPVALGVYVWRIPRRMMSPPRTSWQSPPSMIMSPLADWVAVQAHCCRRSIVPRRRVRIAVAECLLVAYYRLMSPHRTSVAIKTMQPSQIIQVAGRLFCASPLRRLELGSPLQLLRWSPVQILRVAVPDFDVAVHVRCRLCFRGCRRSSVGKVAWCLGMVACVRSPVVRETSPRQGQRRRSVPSPHLGWQFRRRW